jgi:hypothetical protein
VLKTVNPPFDYAKKHSIIRSCSLSDRLPLEVIKAAVAQFGGQLREELGELMNRTSLMEGDDESINSKDFSTDSASDYEIADKSRVGQ